MGGDGARVGLQPIDDTDEDRRRLNAANDWTGPIGTVAAAAIFFVAVRPWVDEGRLLVWIGAIVVAVVLMAVGVPRGPVTDRLGLVGHASTGALWGAASMIGLRDGSTDDRFLWAVLAFQFATSAGVSSGSTIDDRRLGPAVLVAMWPVSAVCLLVVGQPVLAIGAVVFLVIVMGDARETTVIVTELIDRRAEQARRGEEARWLAVHDPLTGVANRTGVAEALDDEPRFGAALFIDLDHFKAINDRLGHHAGDGVLIEVARRIGAFVRDGDMVARVGGDEFVMLVSNTGDDAILRDDALLSRASGIIAELERPMTIVGPERVSLSASIGIARLDGDGALDRVLRDSDDAMYEAKRRGRRQAVIFGDEHLLAQQQRAELSDAVRNVIRDGGIEVWGQPIFCFETGRVVSVELLARWRRGDEFVPPDVFIPIAERIGVTVELTRVLLRCAQSVLHDWAGHDLLSASRVAINVSPTDLRTRTLVDDIDEMIAAGRVAAERLVLEIAESDTLTDVAAMRSMLAPLRLRGVMVSLDDFGSRHSSFDGVRELGVDAVKIDPTIIHLVGDETARGVVSSVANLAEALGRRVVAEGVETGDQITELRRLGFRYMQGYAICEPMPLDELGGERGRRALEGLIARLDRSIRGGAHQR